MLSRCLVEQHCSQHYSRNEGRTESMAFKPMDSAAYYADLYICKRTEHEIFALTLSLVEGI